jgi:hypothetical protein
MKKILLITLCGLFACALHAQITTDERPYGLSVTAKAKLNEQNVITLSAPNRIVIAQEDLINDNNLSEPVRYAYPVDVNYTLENSGVWQELNDGSKIWRLKVKLPGALSTNTMYDKFWLPEGAKFFVYSEDTEQSIGAITSEYIEGSRENPIEFATAIVYGETVVFEYFQPASVSSSAVISISRIDYGYRYVDNPYGNILRSFGDAIDCHININCPEGNNWQTEKHAVARVSIVGPNGSGWCSCALVNNTGNNDTPYVLTAHHCLSGLDAITNSSASQCVFYWEYEHPGCANSTTQPTLRTTTGATVVANNSSTDFALFRLTQNPRNASGVIPYYLGWDRSGSAGTSGVGIHHPMGDVKKISAANQIQNQSSQVTLTDGTSFSANTHWKATFYNGSIERGSSGSPLINNNHRLIGQLHAANTAICNANYFGYYGKFSVSWTGYGATDNRRKLQPWLDPAGTNPTTLNGKTPFSISGPSIVCSGSSSTFTVNNAPASYTWNKSSNLTLVSTSGNTATFSKNGSSNGNGWVSIVVNNVEAIRENVYVGTPVVTSITGPTNTPNGQYANYHANVATGTIPTNYQWILNPQGNNNLYGASSVSLDIAFYTAGNYQLVCRAYNSCGWGEYKTINLNVYSSSSYSIAYPNPVSDILTVSFNPELVAQAKASLQSSGGMQTAKRTFLLNIKLYNDSGVLQHQATSTGENVTLDVSRLKNGFYILHVHDGIADKPEVHKIIVNH